MDELFEENLRRIHSAPQSLDLIGITGGEPTLLGDRLIVLIQEIRKCLPNTEIQLLSNGRRFANYEYVKKIAEAGDGMLYAGVELHSDYYKDHDMIAGAKGAYRDTLLGLYNLALCGISIELRIILCALNYRRLYNISLFIHRNLPFVEWIAFMGMEQTGYAVKNAKKIWIEPIDYQKELLDAVKLLADWNYHVSIFNIPLCLLPTYLHDFARKSISDWKNHYAPICDSCVLKIDCCGFFSTSKNYFQGIRPFCQNTVE